MADASERREAEGARYDHEEVEARWQERWREEKLFETGTDRERPKYYVLDMFPYPSGAGLHVGHPKGYVATDVVARAKRMMGYQVLRVMGWDSFGLPAERQAVKEGLHPREVTERNIETFKRQLLRLGLSYDWTRELATSDVAYYRWTQWIFLKLHEAGLAYQEDVPRQLVPGAGDGARQRGGQGREVRRDRGPGGAPAHEAVDAPHHRLRGEASWSDLDDPRLARGHQGACSATGSAAPRAPRSASRWSARRPRSRCSPRGPTPSSGAPTWCWPPSTRWSPSRHHGRPTRRRPRLRRAARPSARSETGMSEAADAEKTGRRSPGPSGPEPGRRDGGPALDRRLRARELRHGRHHGRARPTTSATTPSPAASSCRSSEVVAGGPTSRRRPTWGTAPT